MIHPTDLPTGPAYRSMPRPGPADDLDDALVEVVVSWGAGNPLAASHLRPGERFVLAAAGVTDAAAHAFVHPAVERGAFTLVEHRGTRCQVTLPPAATATLTSLAAVTLPTGVFELPRGASARIEHGELRYSLRHVPRAERLPARRSDRLFGVATALALAGTVVVGTWVRGLEGHDRVEREDELAQLMTIVHDHTIPARIYAPMHAEGGAGVEGGTGLRARGDEGAAGRRSAPRVARTWSTPPRQGPAREAIVERDVRELVQRRGVFSALGPTGSSPWLALLPGNALDRHASGAMYGLEAGDAHGYEGLGLLGAGAGGGSNEDGLIGLGRLRTRGHGTDDGTGHGIGSGSACGCGEGTLRGRGMSIGCALGRDAVVSSADPAVIRRVVLRNLGQVRRCYENSLAEVPTARGRVSVRWVIGANGAVLASTVTDNDTGSAALGLCIANAVQRWQFPALSAPGAATVNYPFDLSVVEP